MSGVTQPALAIRSVYLLKLHYTAPGGDITAGGENDNSGSTKATISTQKVAALRPTPALTKHASPTTTINLVVRGSPTAAPKNDDEALKEIVSLDDVNLDVYFGYYGVCVGEGGSLRCTNKRPKSAEELKILLYPGGYTVNGTVNSTALTFEKDPQNIISLGLQLQREISPVPLILATVTLGAAWLASLYVSITSGTDYSGVGGANSILADKATFGLATVGFLLLLIAVTFLKVAGDIANQILNGASNTFLLEVAGVEATPGYHAVRIGCAALVIVAGVVLGMAWCLGIGRPGALPRQASEPSAGIRGFIGRFMGGPGTGHADSGWKGSISMPMQVPMYSVPTAPAAYGPGNALHPAFAGGRNRGEGAGVHYV